MLASGIIENLLNLDEEALNADRREKFRRTSAEWAAPEDLGDETSPDEVECKSCYEPMRRVDAFVVGRSTYCGACRKQMDDIANGE
jgi:hypothetical protein